MASVIPMSNKGPAKGGGTGGGNYRSHGREAPVETLVTAGDAGWENGRVPSTTTAAKRVCVGPML